MATTFDLTTYPLQDATQFGHRLSGMVDIMDDGTLRYRSLSSDSFAEIRCRFEPMSAATSAAFETYITNNSATEFEITYNSKTWRGYIDPRTPLMSTEGPWHTWSFNFKGKAV